MNRNVVQTNSPQTNSPYPPRAGPEHNPTRTDVIQKLVAHASKGAQLPMVPWSIPTATAAEIPPSATPGGDTVWKQINGMRVMAQYCASLGEICTNNHFLQGKPITSVKGLEWFSLLNCPMHPITDSMRSYLERTSTLYCLQAGSMPVPEACFQIHKAVPCQDKDLTRLLLSMHFPDSKEYEVEVCANMIAQSQSLTYEQWKRDFPRWRDRGIYHPLCVAAHHMPTVDLWMPGEASSTPLAGIFGKVLDILQRPGTEDPHEQLQILSHVWNQDDTGAAAILADTLDRLCVHMRIKSNGRLANPLDFGLDNALASFPRSFGADPHEANYRAWWCIRSAVEDTFPPSLLCAKLTKAKRPTWGFDTLSLEVFPGPVVRFKERELRWIDAPPATSDSNMVAYTPIGDKGCLTMQTGARVQEILWRLGEIVMSKEMIMAMMYPRASMGSLESPNDPVWRLYDGCCEDRDHVFSHTGLNSLRSAARECNASLGSDVSANAHAAAVTPKGLQSFLELGARLDQTPPPSKIVRLKDPLRLLLWRVDIPPRAIMYTGTQTNPDPARMPTFNFQKAMLNVKCLTRTVGGILSVDGPVKEDTVRAALRRFAASELAQHPANFVYTKTDDELVCTTLAEAVACFASHTTPRRTVCALAGSIPWEDDSIDQRYCERQDGANGFRYRDWMATYVDAQGAQQSRLASHSIEITDRLFTTQLPWLQADGSVKWVHTVCTRPIQNRVLQGKTLKQAVETRYLQDTKLLPVRKDSHTVTRGNTEIYTEGNTVAIAYAPTQRKDEDNAVELIAFQEAAAQ